MTKNEKRIKKKLRSKKGASITFGLLLFLICAIISSLVLVAGTSAAGRLAGMAQTEQRYYSVSSTAKMIQEILEDGTAATIEVNEKKYLVSNKDGNTLQDISSDALKAKTLPEYLAYKICSNAENFKVKQCIPGTSKDQEVSKCI